MNTRHDVIFRWFFLNVTLTVKGGINKFLVKNITCSNCVSFTLLLKFPIAVPLE